MALLELGELLGDPQPPLVVLRPEVDHEAGVGGEVGEGGATDDVERGERGEGLPERGVVVVGGGGGVGHGEKKSKEGEKEMGNVSWG